MKFKFLLLLLLPGFAFATSFTDTFTGTSGTAITTYNANYSYWEGGSTHNILEIGTNSARIQFDAAQSNGSTIRVARADLTFANNQYIEATMDANAAATGDVYIYVRGATGAFNSGYELDIEAGSLAVFRSDTGAQIGSGFAHTLAAADIIRLTAVSTTITVTLNGTPVISVTDSTFTSGKPSFGGIGSTFVNPHAGFDTITMADVVAPSFSSAPTVTGTTSSVYTQSATPSASSTWYAVAYPTLLSAPTCTQIKAGQNSSSASAVAANSKAITGADTLTLTIPGTPRPIHSISSCLSNGLDSAVTTLTSQLLTAPAGKQFTTAAVPWAGGTDSVFLNASPAVANGDIEISDVASTPDNYSITDFADGTFSIANGGSRQSFVTDVYDISLDTLYGTFTTYVNDAIPFLIGQAPNMPNAQTGMAITPVNWNVYFGDNDDPTLTITVSPSSTNSLPTGLSLSAGTVAGSVTSAGTSIVTFRATDIAGEFVESLPWTITSATAVSVPNVVNETLAQATSDLVAANLIVPGQGVAYVHSAVVTSGNVVSQTPAAATSVAPASEVALVVSLGKGGATGLGLRLGLFLQ